ncbi:MAG: hypothetical protein KF916_06395 [Microbacteriaceae bacterium]|nr:hypothetical protein [Microbacteriaceae bacterium]
MRRTAIANPFCGFGQQRLNEISEQVIGFGGLLFVVDRHVSSHFEVSDDERLVSAVSVDVGSPAAFSCQELSHRGVEFVANHFVVDDVDALEDGLVEKPPRLVGGVAV